MAWDVLKVPADGRSLVMEALIRLYVMHPVDFYVFGKRGPRGDVHLYLSARAGKLARKVSFLSERMEGRVKALPEHSMPVLGDQLPVG